MQGQQTLRRLKKGQRKDRKAKKWAAYGGGAQLACMDLHSSGGRAGSADRHHASAGWCVRHCSVMLTQKSWSNSQCIVLARLAAHCMLERGRSCSKVAGSGVLMPKQCGGIRHAWRQLQRALEEAQCFLVFTLQAEAVAGCTPVVEVVVGREGRWSRGSAEVPSVQGNEWLHVQGDVARPGTRLKHQEERKKGM